MTDKQESMLRQLYILPECPTVETVWQQWRDMGESTTVQEVREVLWAMPLELYTYRHIDLDHTDRSQANRMRELYSLETNLIRARQEHQKSGIRLPVFERDLDDLIGQVQRKLADAMRETGVIG